MAPRGAERATGRPRLRSSRCRTRWMRRRVGSGSRSSTTRRSRPAMSAPRVSPVGAQRHSATVPMRAARAILRRPARRPAGAAGEHRSRTGVDAVRRFAIHFARARAGVGPVHEGKCSENGSGQRQVVQRREGLRLHRPGRRRPGRFRPLLGHQSRVTATSKRTSASSSRSPRARRARRRRTSGPSEPGVSARRREGMRRRPLPGSTRPPTRAASGPAAASLPDRYNGAWRAVVTVNDATPARR